MNQPKTPVPNPPAAGHRPALPAAELYPKPIRVYPTREQRRAWVWAAKLRGVSVFKLLEMAGDEITRAAVAEAIARKRTVPPDIAQTVAGFQESKKSTSAGHQP